MDAYHPFTFVVSVDELGHFNPTFEHVVGHTGKGVLARLFQGSVGAELLNNLQCSLLVATGEA